MNHQVPYTPDIVTQGVRNHPVEVSPQNVQPAAVAPQPHRIHRVQRGRRSRRVRIEEPPVLDPEDSDDDIIDVPIVGFSVVGSSSGHLLVFWGNYPRFLIGWSHQFTIETQFMI